MRTDSRFTGLLILPLLCGVLLMGAISVSPMASAENLKNDTGHDTSKSTIKDLSLGDYWWGAEIEPEDLEGKVVLFEIWGS